MKEVVARHLDGTARVLERQSVAFMEAHGIDPEQFAETFRYLDPKALARATLQHVRSGDPRAYEPLVRKYRMLME